MKNIVIIVIVTLFTLTGCKYYTYHHPEGGKPYPETIAKAKDIFWGHWF
jgi:hypothetical protein